MTGTTLARLDDAGIATRALAIHQLTLSIACHEAMFVWETDSNRQRIDYHVVVPGNLSLVLIPSGTAQVALPEDCGNMLSVGMLPGEDEPFDILMQRFSVMRSGPIPSRERSADQPRPNHGCLPLSRQARWWEHEVSSPFISRRRGTMTEACCRQHAESLCPRDVATLLHRSPELLGWERISDGQLRADV